MTQLDLTNWNNDLVTTPGQISDVTVVTNADGTFTVTKSAGTYQDESGIPGDNALDFTTYAPRTAFDNALQTIAWQLFDQTTGVSTSTTNGGSGVFKVIGWNADGLLLEQYNTTSHRADNISTQTGKYYFLADPTVGIDLEGNGGVPDLATFGTDPNQIPTGFQISVLASPPPTQLDLTNWNNDLVTTPGQISDVTVVTNADGTFTVTKSAGTYQDESGIPGDNALDFTTYAPRTAFDNALQTIAWQLFDQTTGVSTSTTNGGSGVFKIIGWNADGLLLEQYNTTSHRADNISTQTGKYYFLADPTVGIDLEGNGGIPDLATFGTDPNQIPTGFNLTVLACFAAGTHIRVPDGEARVESLREGDPVLTVAGETKKVKWVGRRTVNCDRHPSPKKMRPVRIMAHAFGPGQPARDLYLSPDHAVYAEGVLIPVKQLLNGSTIAQVQVAEVTYYHVELDRHDVILAEGLPAETFLDTGNRTAFHGDAMQLHPMFERPSDLNLVWEAQGYAPLTLVGSEVEAVRRHLHEQADALGFGTDALTAA